MISKTSSATYCGAPGPAPRLTYEICLTRRCFAAGMAAGSNATFSSALTPAPVPLSEPLVVTSFAYCKR